MAREKNAFKGNSLKPNYLVEKSNDFITTTALANCDAITLKAMDIYMSVINARDPSTNTVVFTRKSFCDLMGINQRTKIDNLKTALQTLQTTVISFPIFYTDSKGKTKYKGCRHVTLFNKSEIVQDAKTGDCVITMKCNDDASDLFFQLQEKGYTRYMVQNSINLTSKHAILLYNILKMEQGRQRGKEVVLTIGLNELRMKLGATDKTNLEYKYFKRTLNNCCDDINQHTDIETRYESIYNGRFVDRIVFTIKKNDSQSMAEDPKPSWVPVSEEESPLASLTPVIGACNENPFANEDVLPGDLLDEDVFDAPGR